MKDEITERIAQFIEAKGMSIRAFERSLNLTEGVIAKAMRHGTAFSHQYLWKIAVTYPELDMEWLIRGKGEPPVPEDTEEVTLTKGKLKQMIQHEVAQALQREMQSLSKT